MSELKIDNPALRLLDVLEQGQRQPVCNCGMPMADSRVLRETHSRWPAGCRPHMTPVLPSGCKSTKARYLKPTSSHLPAAPERK